MGSDDPGLEEKSEGRAGRVAGATSSALFPVFFTNFLAAMRRLFRRLARRRYRRGFSLFGVLLGLGLAATVIVGVVGIYNSARESANRMEVLTLLNQIRVNTESVFAGAPSYGSDTNLVAMLDLRGGIPDKARLEVGGVVQITHPFGGSVAVVGGPGGVANRFQVTFEDVDNEVCAALGDAYAGRTRARAGVISIVVNTIILAAPATIEQITTNCNAGAGANDIGFVFG